MAQSHDERIKQIANSTHLDENGTPILVLQIRYYTETGGHVYVRGLDEDGKIEGKLPAADVAEAIEFATGIIRRGEKRAKRLRKEVAA